MTHSKVCINVENSSNSPSCLDEAMETQQKSSIAFIKYFSKIMRQMKENAGYFLIETDLLDTRSYFLSANQNARPYSHRNTAVDQ